MTTSTLSRMSTQQSKLGYLPVALFSAVMGLTGLAVSWRFAHVHFDTPTWVAQLIAVIAVLSFIAQTVAYIIKAVTGFENVRAEFSHYVASNLFGTPLISLLSLPIILADINLMLARAIWLLGAISMTVFAWMIVLRWIEVAQKPAHATPAWIVPVVGLINIPLAVPALGWYEAAHGVMLFALAVGFFFTIPLFTMILSRLMFEEPIPEAMQPLLLILAAPFAVGFSAYVTTVGHVDMFAEVLYMLMLFMLAVLFGRVRHLRHCCPFRASWWAVSFPLAASATAALRYAIYAQSPVADLIAVLLLAIATTAIAALLIRTVFGIALGHMRELST
jgi:tellurite resistance protein